MAKEIKLKAVKFFKHPFIIALIPVVAALIGYCWINYRNTCPTIEKNDISQLIAIEERLFSDGIKQGEGPTYIANEALYEDILNTVDFDLANDKRDVLLGNYFKATNNPLFSHVSMVSAHIANNVPHHGVTYLYGSAGVGKSFIKLPITKIFKQDSCVINLNKAIRTGRKYGSIIEQSPQLYSEQYVLGELPRIKEPASFKLNELLIDCGCETEVSGQWKKVVIFDDLDEIHPESSKLILELVNDFLIKHEQYNPQGFLMVFVIGRPEAFSAWLSDSHHSYVKNFNTFTVKGPGFEYVSDIELMAMNYFMYVRHSKPMKDSVEALKKAFQKKNYLFASSSSNLSNANYSLKRLIENPDYTDAELKEKLFSDYLARNSGSHNRPERREEKGETYEHLLQNIAVKYSDSLDKEGYFEVDISDNIKTLHKPTNKSIDVFGDLSNCKEKTLIFNVQQALEFSGIVNIEPVNDKIKRYRFRPFWVHRFLVEKRNNRS